MYCPKCNGPMEMGSLFCPHCGAKIDNNDNSNGGNNLSQSANDSLNNVDNTLLSNAGSVTVPVIMNNHGSNDLNTSNVNDVNLSYGTENGTASSIGGVSPSNVSSFNVASLETNNNVNTDINNNYNMASMSPNNLGVANTNIVNSNVVGNGSGSNISTNGMNTSMESVVSNANINSNMNTDNSNNTNLNMSNYSPNQSMNTSMESVVSNANINSNINTDNSNNTNLNMSNYSPNQSMNISNNSSVNSNAISKVNKSGNLITIILVLVIAIVAVVVCYLMISGNKSNTTNKDKNVVATDNTSEVTINGRTGKVPKGWSFISGIEAGSAEHESVFIKDTRDSVALISSTNEVTFGDIKKGMYTVKAKFESLGFSELNATTDKKNGIEYVLFDGLYDGSNYHILYFADGVGVSGSEGYYASSEDLMTIINFMTSLKKNTVTKGIISDNNVNFFNTMIGK